MVCIGAIIGAGFASGKELVSFFGQNGFWSLLFIPLVAVLFFCCFFLFSKLGKLIKPKSISDLTSAMFGKVHIFVDFCFILCTFITLSSMLAGCDSIGYLTLGVNYNFCYFSIVSVILVMILLSFGLKWIYKTNNFILPTILILMLGIVITFFFIGKNDAISTEITSVNAFSGVTYCFLYASMNIFTNIFIISKTSQILTKKQVFNGSVIASLMLCAFITLIICSILTAGQTVFSSDMPMVSLAFNLSYGLGIVYSIVLWLAIFSTICIATYTIQTWLNNFIKSKFVCLVITLTVGFVLSRFGFSTIVDVFYPLEGIFALVIIIYSTVYYFKNKSRYKRYYNIQKENLSNEKISASLDITIPTMEENYIENNTQQEMASNKSETLSLNIKSNFSKVRRKKQSNKEKN